MFWCFIVMAHVRQCELSIYLVYLFVNQWSVYVFHVFCCSDFRFCSCLNTATRSTNGPKCLCCQVIKGEVHIVSHTTEHILIYSLGTLETQICPFVFICFVLYLYKRRYSKGPLQTAQTDQEHRLYLHLRITELKLWPVTRLNSSLASQRATASVEGGGVVLNLVYSLSSQSVSQLCRLCLRSVFHPSQFPSLFLTDAQLVISSLSLSLPLCVCLVVAGCCRLL